MAWPDFHRGWKSRSTNRWQHRLQREHPTCTERTKNRSSKSADGRVATVAARAGEKPCPTKKERIHLTPTGLLMEGHAYNGTTLVRKTKKALGAPIRR